MNKIFLLLILFIGIFSNLKASEKTYPFSDTSYLDVNLVQQDDLQNYYNDDDFEYLKTPVLIENNNILTRLFNLVKQGIKSIVELMGVIPLLLHLFFWGAVIVLVVVIITKTKLNKIFYSDQNIKSPEYAVSTSEESYADIEQAIKHEIERKNYRKAIRLYFLMIINTLDEKELIRFSKEKTNTDYLRELPDKNIKEEFQHLTTIYNNVWYGLFNIEEKEFRAYEGSFTQFFVGLDV